jgi:hypothetical protein
MLARCWPQRLLLVRVLPPAGLQLLPSGPPLLPATLAAPALELIWRFYSGQADVRDMPVVLRSGLVSSWPVAAGDWQFSGAGALAVFSGYVDVQASRMDVFGACRMRGQLLPGQG